MIKNASNLYPFAIQDQLSNGLTGQTPSVFLRQDSGSFAAASGSVTEVDSTNYPGLYQITLTATECNCNVLTIAVSLPDGQEPAILDVVYPVTTGGATVNEIWGRQAGDTTSRTLTSSPTDISSLATADALSSVASNVSAVKAKTDNLPESPAAVGSAMALTEATVSTVRNNLATVSTIEAAVVSLSSGLDTLAGHGDTYWSTADVSGLSTFDASTDAVTLTDAYDAAKTASQFDPATDAVTIGEASEQAIRSGLSTFNPATDAVTIDSEQASTFATAQALSIQEANIAYITASILHWAATASTLTLYDNNGAAIGVYDLTRDSSGNITAIEPHEEG